MKNNDTTFLIVVIVVIILLVVLYKILKPYFIHYDTTLLFCGGLGSGKSLNSVKYAIRLYKKSVWKVKILNFKVKIYNLLHKKNKKVLHTLPLLVSNLPIYVKKKFITTPLNLNILTLKEKIPEYSVVFIDELPQLVNQFNWNITEVQHNLNEFIAMFRHYIGGYLIVNGQAESEIVKQIRSKLNSYFWCYDFQKFLCFYRVRILHSMISDNEVSLSSDFIEDNTKWTYGILTKNYDTRAYRYRYLNSNLPMCAYELHKQKYVIDLLRFEKWVSPLDKKGKL